MGKGFSSNFAHQVQFSPGQKEASWSLQIVDDDVFEGEELLSVYIAHTELATTVDPSVIFITIQDPEDGKKKTLKCRNRETM